MICPNCKTNLEGGLIYQTFLDMYNDEEKALKTAKMYGATKTEGHWGREIGIEIPGKYDGVSFWRCPDCDHEWSRF